MPSSVKRAQVTTSDMYEARGASNQTTLTRDLNAGLFAGCEPQRVSPGPASAQGVFHAWPRQALVRARWIRALIALRLSRGDIKDLVDRGRAPTFQWKVLESVHLLK